MNELKTLQLKLLELNKIINDHKIKLQVNPEDLETRLSLVSFESLYVDFKAQYMELAKDFSFDVIDYRLISTADDMSITEITESLNIFQTLFSLVYDVVINKTPKNTSRLSKEIMSSSALKYGYSYSGSIGFVLTIDSHNNLLDKPIETAVEETLSLVSIDDRKQLDDSIKKFGVATIKVLNNWISTNHKYNNELEIKTNNDRINPIFIDSKKLESISEIISREPLVTNEMLKFDQCELVGADTLTATFHIVNGSDSYKGLISENIDMNFSIPSLVSATINEEVIELNGRVSKRYLLISIKENIGKDV